MEIRINFTDGTTEVWEADNWHITEEHGLLYIIQGKVEAYFPMRNIKRFSIINL